MIMDARHAGNVILLRGATLALLVALILAWCVVGKHFGVTFLTAFFAGKTSRMVQSHIDFLLMGALIFGFYAAKVPLPWHARWAMVIGAFTNSSLFLVEALVPAFDPTTPVAGTDVRPFLLSLFVSISITTYGFGMGAITVFRSTLKAVP
jgi:hypothetical protein